MATKIDTSAPDYYSQLGKRSWKNLKKVRDKAYFSAIAAKSHPRESYAGGRPPSRMITYKRKTQSIADWAKELGISKSTLYGRIMTYKWPLKKALTPKSSVG